MFIRKFLLVFLLFTAGYGTALRAQWMQPNRIKAGASLGFGGLHTWGKPSFDINWWRFTFRMAPGFNFFSTGVTYKLYFFKPRQRKDRMVILSAYYHNDWLLANKKSNELRKDQQIYMLMPGIHVNLNYLGTIYFEVSGGLMYTHERILAQDKSMLSARDHFWPMGELRIGGIFMSRIEYHQKFPHKVKYPPADKVKKVKLKWKK